jgi:hypothetical protein
MHNAEGGPNRRAFLAGLGAAAAGAMFASPLEAAEQTAAEKANIQVVKDFCAAWPSHDLEKILGFFADNGSYRMTETMEPTKGRVALIARL